MNDSGAGFRRSFKEWDVEAWIDAWFYRPIAELVARALAPLSVRPNQVSFWSALAGLASGLCYWQFSYPFIVAGGLLLSLSVVFDAADGQLARRTGQSSEIGKLFDNVMDPIKATAAMFGIAFGMAAVGHWGPGWPMPDNLSASTAIWGLGWLAGLSLPLQVVTRNAWVDRYHQIGKGRSSLTMADITKVREEFAELRTRKGFWLEKIVVPMVSAFSPKDPPAKPTPTPNPEYVRRMRPLIRLWTFYGGGQQFFVITVVSLFGAPVLGWLYVGVVTNVLYLLLLGTTILAHRRALAAS